MKAACLILILLGSVVPVPGQEETVTLDDILQSAQRWATNNLDEDTLAALQDVDQQKVSQFLAEIQTDFQGEHVIDLARLKENARVILPLLESQEQTRPYAAWLRARLDYLEVAEQLRLIIPPPGPDLSKSPQQIPLSQPEQQRQIWVRKLSQREWPKTAEPYVSELKPIFAEAKVPPDLVWIAEVESSFDPRARSPAGAVGLFQLMPATARQYGLRTWPFDQRLNGETSGRAAAKHLNYLYHRFKNWRLALAAYNAGEGTVRRLLDRRDATTYDAIADGLPAETQMYVPKVEAVLLRREGVKLDDLPPAGS